MKNKKGLSNLVAYVLLIVITLALSVTVYNWLKVYVSEPEVETCSDDVNIILASYSCVGDNLNITLKNKGLFEVDGYILRGHNRSDARAGIYLIEELNVSIPPGGEYFKEYDVGGVVDNITFLEVQPFMIEDDKVRCSSYLFQKINC